MRIIRTRIRAGLLAGTAAAALAMTAAGCSSDGSGGDSGGGGTAKKAAATPASGAASGASKGTASAASGQPFGPACAAVPDSGSGSFSGMAKDPVATAASHNPALSTLVAAVQKAGLVDTLNTAQNITVFAPTNDAFNKIPKAQLQKVLNDKATLTKILTYHVVGRRLTPAQLQHGTFPTLEKQTLTTAGSGTSYTVNGTAKVVCGNVQTANATVYLIDTVLMPPAS